MSMLQVLSWITQQKERASVDEIEDVDRPMLEMLLDQMEAVTVVFCQYNQLLSTATSFAHVHAYTRV